MEGQIGFVRGFGVATELPVGGDRICFSLPSLRPGIIGELLNPKNRVIFASGDKVAIVGTGRNGVVTTLAGFNFSRKLYLESPLPPLRPDFLCYIIMTCLAATVIGLDQPGMFGLNFFYLGILIAGPYLVLAQRFYSFKQRVDRAQAVLGVLMERITGTIPPPPPPQSKSWYERFWERQEKRSAEIDKMPPKCLFCDSSDIVDSLKISQMRGFIRAWTCPRHVYKRGLDPLTFTTITFFVLYVGVVGNIALLFIHNPPELLSIFRGIFWGIMFSTFIFVFLYLISNGKRVSETRQLTHMRGAYE